MKKPLEVSNPVYREDGTVYLQINGKPYSYRCDDDKYRSWEIFKTYCYTFIRNKGKFLSKIKNFLVEDEHGGNNVPSK